MASTTRRSNIEHEKPNMVKIVSTALQPTSQLLSSTLTPYIQLTRVKKPAGWFLIFLPAVWGLTMAARREQLPPYELAIKTALYAFETLVLRSAGCTINDLCDRNFDRQVARTKSRPLAAGTITPQAAAIFFMLLTAILVGMLGLANSTTTWLGLIGQIICGVYPLMKRITFWPQAWLGIAMNWGMVVAWSSVTGSPNWTIVGPPLFGAFCWTIYYDTIYACQDKRDDAAAGVKSTALLFGDKIKPILALFGGIFVTSLAIAGKLNNHGPAFWILAVCASALQIGYQLARVDLDDPASCAHAFSKNTYIGTAIWIGLLVDYCMR